MTWKIIIKSYVFDFVNIIVNQYTYINSIKNHLEFLKYNLDYIFWNIFFIGNINYRLYLKYNILSIFNKLNIDNILYFKYNAFMDFLILFLTKNFNLIFLVNFLFFFLFLRDFFFKLIFIKKSIIFILLNKSKNIFKDIFIFMQRKNFYLNYNNYYALLNYNSYYNLNKINWIYNYSKPLLINIHIFFIYRYIINPEVGSKYVLIILYIWLIHNFLI